MPINEMGLKTYSNRNEQETQKGLLSLFKNTPIPESEILENLGLFISSKLFARILFLQHIYLKQLDIHGIIMDFGTRWGQNMSVFSALRGIYEPFNRHRRIIGFDTFKGFPSVSIKDGRDAVVKKDGYKVTPGYEKYLDALIGCQDKLNPAGHLKKHEIIKGDASVTIKKYLGKHPETIVSLAYFDMDLYEPTLQCLKALKPHLTKGSVIAFDELCDEGFPGETLAFREIFGQQYRLSRLPITSRTSYIVLD
jgi:hypothetical protein